MKKNNSIIDLKEEYISIIKYLEKRWNLSDQFIEKLNSLWVNGENHFKDSYYLIDLKDSITADDLRFLVKNNISYVDVKNYIENQLSESENLFEEIKPLNWKENVEEYLRVGDGYRFLEIYQMKKEKSDLKDFQGTIVHYTENRNFCISVSTENILYDEIYQGNKAHIVLIETVISHLLDCIRHNNLKTNKNGFYK